MDDVDVEIRAVIVDDEPPARRGVEQLLERHGDVRVVGEARDGPEAVRVIRATGPDLVFLDIQMPGLDGFGVLRRLIEERAPAVVFLTAHDRYAVRAFEVDAVDYLMKPASRSRFDRCMDRVRTWLEIRRAEDDGPPAGRRPSVLLAGTPRGERLVRPEEIDWIEAADYYAAIHAGGERLLIRESLRALEERLPERLFMRVHRSAIVNLGRIERHVTAGKGGGRLVLRGGAEVPVSRRQRGELRERLKELGGAAGPADTR
ncbi:MAG: LytR/AlgR family response regulator transcription factor [Gemmatimonadota bacterium]